MGVGGGNICFKINGMTTNWEGGPTIDMVKKGGGERGRAQENNKVQHSEAFANGA